MSSNDLAEAREDWIQGHVQFDEDFVRTHGPVRSINSAQALHALFPVERLLQERAEAWVRGRFLTVNSRSGCFGAVPFADPHSVDLPPDASDLQGGEAVVVMSNPGIASTLTLAHSPRRARRGRSGGAGRASRYTAYAPRSGRDLPNGR